MKKPEPSRRISVLREDVSRKIAAGEVIDRPLSIVRELLDNALDAGAGVRRRAPRSGGLDRVRVVDDGAGMDRDDLSRCWLPHATSKIETEDDLLRVTSLGFRGEALSSMATASRLEMVSCPPGGVAHRLVVRGGRQEALEPCQGRPGTVVDVSELFFNYPARKKFLRSPSAEAGLCRSVFLDRASAFPAVSFRLFADDALRLSLPAADHIQRHLALPRPRSPPARNRRGEGAGVHGAGRRRLAGRPSHRSPAGAGVRQRPAGAGVLPRAGRGVRVPGIPARRVPPRGIRLRGHRPVARGFQHPSGQEGGPVPQPPRGAPGRGVRRPGCSSPGATRSPWCGTSRSARTSYDATAERAGFPSDRRPSPPAAAYPLPDRPPVQARAPGGPASATSARRSGCSSSASCPTGSCCSTSTRPTSGSSSSDCGGSVPPCRTSCSRSPSTLRPTRTRGSPNAAPAWRRWASWCAGRAARTWEVTGLAAGLVPLPADALVEALRHGLRRARRSGGMRCCARPRAGSRSRKATRWMP